eukprot:6212692-Pleurochrysis_carterae.AAC.3
MLPERTSRRECMSCKCECQLQRKRESLRSCMHVSEERTSLLARYDRDTLVCASARWLDLSNDICLQEMNRNGKLGLTENATAHERSFRCWSHVCGRTTQKVAKSSASLCGACAWRSTQMSGAACVVIDARMRPTCSEVGHLVGRVLGRLVEHVRTGRDRRHVVRRRWRRVVARRSRRSRRVWARRLWLPQSRGVLALCDALDLGPERAGATCDTQHRCLGPPGGNGLYHRVRFRELNTIDSENKVARLQIRSLRR